MDLVPLRRGVAVDIYAVRDGDRIFEREYVCGLPERDQEKVLRLYSRVGDHGPPTSQQKFRSLGDGLYELKSGAHRLFCFFQPGGRWVIRHGYRKQRQKADQREIERARRLWAQSERDRRVR